MGAYYDEVEIEDMAWDEEKKVYHYPCPCGDRFEISRKQLRNYEDIATCPSCSLIIRVIYDPVSINSVTLLSQYLVHRLFDLLQLDFEDEDEDDASETASNRADESDSEDDDFEDAMENLHISS